MGITAKVIYIIQRFWPAIFIFLLWFTFSSPYFLKGRVPFPSTYQVNNFAPWDAYPELRGPVKNGAMPDIITQIYPWKYFTISTYKKGELPLWNPYSFGGTPHLANYQSAVLSPFNLLFFLLPFVDAWSVLILLQPLLAGIAMYCLLRRFFVSQMGSLISAIAFMFCGFITVWMDYGTLGYAILFLPMALYGIESFYQTKKLAYIFLIAAAFPLSFFSGHFQISIYFAIAVSLYWVYTCFQKKQRREQIIILFSILSGLLMTLPQVLPSMELYTQSLRSGIFQKIESIPWMYLPTLLAPDFFGNPVTRNDWFGHYAEWNAYIGVLPIMLSIYAMRKRNSQKIFFFFVGLIALILTFPTPLVDMLIALHIPVLSTSSLSRIIVLYSFSFAILAGFGFDDLFADIKTHTLKPIFIWIGSFLLLFLLLWMWIFGKFILPIDKILIAKQNLILPTAIFVEVIVAISLSLLLQSSLKKKLLSFVGIILLLTVTFDMWRFATKWQPFDPKNLVFTRVPVSAYLEKISGFERVIGNFGGEAAVYYGLPSLGGYDPLYIDRYGTFIASLGTGKIHSAERSVVTFDSHSSAVPRAINLLNVRYIVHKTSDDFVPWTFPYWDYPSNQFRTIYADPSYKILENTATYPHAFLVNSYQVIPNEGKNFSTLFDNRLDLRHQIVLEKDPHIAISQAINSGKVTITEFKPNLMELTVGTDRPSLLFTSDPYYAGWRAYVDKKNTPILRADYAFRAIAIPAGHHAVQFIYKPRSFIYGCMGFVVGIVSLLFMYVKVREQRK